MDTLILKIYFLVIKLNNFRGELSDISVKTATLAEAISILSHVQDHICEKANKSSDRSFCKSVHCIQPPSFTLASK